MTPGQPDVLVIRRHLLALDGAVRQLRHHAGRPLSALRADPDAQWAVERGLQLYAQNALDIATHLAASAGRDAPDYASAIDVLGTLGVLPTEFAGLDDFVEFAPRREIPRASLSLVIPSRAPVRVRREVFVPGHPSAIAPVADAGTRIDR